MIIILEEVTKQLKELDNAFTLLNLNLTDQINKLSIYAQIRQSFLSHHNFLMKGNINIVLVNLSFI